MQKIHQFLQAEIAVAIKDRPAVFQIITLTLFAFSVTVILVSSVLHLSTPEKEQPNASRGTKELHYANYVSSPASSLLHLKK